VAAPPPSAPATCQPQGIGFHLLLNLGRERNMSGTCECLGPHSRELRRLSERSRLWKQIPAASRSHKNLLDSLRGES
jgi:hypothetical protein